MEAQPTSHTPQPVTDTVSLIATCRPHPRTDRDAHAPTSLKQAGSLSAQAPKQYHVPTTRGTWELG